MNVREKENATTEKLFRSDIIQKIRERDGDICALPGCLEMLDFTIKDGPREVTIDHWIPQWYGREQGWTHDEIWDLSNLRLMSKKCNAKKAERVPLEDGTLPERVVKDFRYRRQKRAERPDICTSCNSGRDLGPSEVCASCSSGPMPERFPRWAKVSAPECDHELFWCWSCSIGITPRVSSVDIAVRSGESGEWDS